MESYSVSHRYRARQMVWTGIAGLMWVLAATFPVPAVASAEDPPGGADGKSQGLRLEKIGSGERAFHVVSTLILGPTESILWDAQYKMSDGKRLAEQIAATGTKLKAIVLSHADHDHYMGAMAVLERFPGTPVYMSRAGLEDFRGRSQEDLAYERKRGPDPDVPDRLVEPRLLPGTTLYLDGHELRVIEGLTGDVRAPVSTALWIPSIRTVLAADLVFEGIHPWLGDSDIASRIAWRESLRQLAALDPVAVVPGHKRDLTTPDKPEQIRFMMEYLDAYDAFMRTAATPEEVAKAMVARYPDLAIPGLMAYGAKTWFKQ